MDSSAPFRSKRSSRIFIFSPEAARARENTCVRGAEREREWNGPASVSEVVRDPQRISARHSWKLFQAPAQAAGRGIPAI